MDGVMETKINKVGTSLGVIIPGIVAKNYDLKNGTKIEIELKNGFLVIKKKSSVREGWDEAFAQYAKEGEDDMLLPDHLDAETERLL